MTERLRTVGEIKRALAAGLPVIATWHDHPQITMFGVKDARGRRDATGCLILSLLIQTANGEAWREYILRDTLTVWVGYADSTLERWLGNGACFCSECLPAYRPQRVFFRCRRHGVSTGEYLKGDIKGVETIFRLERGKVIPMFWDKKCPLCKELRTAKPLQATLNPSHKCTSACWNAKSADCTCSCGGLSHGLGHHYLEGESA